MLIIICNSGSYASQLNQYSNQYANMNGSAVPTYSISNPIPAPTVPSYSTGTTGMGLGSSVSTYGAGGQVQGSVTGSAIVNKGPLANKYPPASVASSMYGGVSNYQTNNTYNPLDYNQQPQPNYYRSEKTLC